MDSGPSGGISASPICRLGFFFGVIFFHYATSTRFTTALLVDLNYSSSSIGLVLGVMRIVTSLFSPVVSAFSDAVQTHRRILLLMTFLRSIPYLFIGYLSFIGELTITWFWVLFGAFALLSSGISPICDSLVLAGLEDKNNYGKTRLWAAITYGIGTFLMGVLIQEYGGYSPIFVCFFFTTFMSLAAIATLLPASAGGTTKQQPQKISFRSVSSICTKSLAMSIFFINFCLVGAMMSLVENMLFVVMERSMEGNSPMLAGTSVLISVLPEIPLFQIAPKLLSSWGPKRMILVCQGALIFRALCYSYFSAAWITLLLELLHGVAFALASTAGINICVERCPVGMESTMQSLLDMTFYGFGPAFGIILGGRLFDVVGPAQTFLIFSAFLTVSMFFFSIIFPSDRLNDKNKYEELNPGLELPEFPTSESTLKVGSLSHGAIESITEPGLSAKY